MRRQDRQTSMSGYNHLSHLTSPRPLVNAWMVCMLMFFEGSFRTLEIGHVADVMRL